jgi:hypothetical protein
VAGRVRALVWGLVLAAAAAGCEAEPEPQLTAMCAPDGSLQRVTCTIRNHGKKAGRACFRARLQPQEGEPLIARRVCTKVLGPDEGAEVPAMFERLGRLEPAELLTSVCAPSGQWTCKADVLETPREMTENQPKPR